MVLSICTHPSEITIQTNLYRYWTKKCNGIPSIHTYSHGHTDECWRSLQGQWDCSLPSLMSQQHQAALLCRPRCSHWKGRLTLSCFTECIDEMKAGGAISLDLLIMSSPWVAGIVAWFHDLSPSGTLDSLVMASLSTKPKLSRHSSCWKTVKNGFRCDSLRQFACTGASRKQSWTECWPRYCIQSLVQIRLLTIG